MKKTQTETIPPIEPFDLSYIAPRSLGAAFADAPDKPIILSGEMSILASLSQMKLAAGRKIAFEQFRKRMMSPIEDAHRLLGSAYADWVASCYPERTCPFIVIGPSIGSLAYFSAILNAPFLPINYAVTVRHPKPIDPDDIKEFSKLARQAASEFITRDPSLEAIVEYDPVHKRFDVANGAAVRLRFTALPEAYKNFIRRNLAPRGTVIIVEPRFGWRQYRLIPRVNLQVGLPGGIEDEEYQRGSKRIEKFQERFQKEKLIPYRLSDSMEFLPESRFGMTPQFRDSAIASIHSIKRNALQIATPDVFSLNRLVTQLYVRISRREGKRPKIILVHSGAFIAPWASLASRILPLWVPDGSFPSYRYAQDFIRRYGFEITDLLIALEPNPVNPPDLLSIKRWAELAPEGVKAQYICNSPRLYPFDLKAYVNFWNDINNFSRRHPDSFDMRARREELIEEASACEIICNDYLHEDS